LVGALPPCDGARYRHVATMAVLASPLPGELDVTLDLYTLPSESDVTLDSYTGQQIAVALDCEGEKWSWRWLEGREPWPHLI
jgi:hypothetical protein